MKIKCLPSFLAVFILCAMPLWPQSSLVSIKKGNRGDKSWVRIRQERDMVAFRRRRERYRLLSGRSGRDGRFGGTIDSDYNRSILVKQVKPIRRYSGRRRVRDEPALSVLKNGRSGRFQR
jgi:hypothetical protein